MFDGKRCGIDENLRDVYDQKFKTFTSARKVVREKL